MKMLHKIKPHMRVLPILLLTITALAGNLMPANAQIKNFSDWNVPPPPLPPPPGSNTKANTTTNKITVSIPGDIPAISQPATGPVQFPVLAALGTIAPAVNTPDQPAILGDGTNLAEIPSPDAPDAPPMPKQTAQDAPAATIADLPLPESPELPPVPAQPVPQGQPTSNNSPYPVMPDVVELPNPTLPFADLVEWSTPAIPESVPFRLIKPVGTKAGSARGKGTRKGKASSSRKIK